MMGFRQSFNQQTVVSFLRVLVSLAYLRVWSGGLHQRAWDPPHTLPHHQSHWQEFLSGQVRCVGGQENGLHVVPLASALVKSLTELDLRWPFLAVQMCRLGFFFLGECCTTSAEVSNYSTTIKWQLGQNSPDGFQRKRSGSVRPALALALHRDGAGRWTLHACLLVRAQGPTW